MTSQRLPWPAPFIPFSLYFLTLVPNPSPLWSLPFPAFDPSPKHPITSLAHSHNLLKTPYKEEKEEEKEVEEEDSPAFNGHIRITAASESRFVAGWQK